MERIKIGFGSMCIVTAMLISALAIGVVASDSHTMNPELTVGNTLPTITGMAVGSASYDPTESGNTTVTVYINVTDINGVEDLDDSKATIQVDDAATFAAAVGKYTRVCTPLANHSSTVREYQCQTDLEFFDAAGTYSTNMTAGDQVGTVWNNTDTNAPTFTYTTLVASTVDENAINFNGVTLGAANSSAVNNPTTVTNTGNANLQMNVTGADMTGGVHGETIGIGNFSVSLDATPTAEMILSDSTQQIIVGGVNATASAGASSTEDLYWYVDVPATLQPDTYTASWTLGTYEL